MLARRDGRLTVNALPLEPFSPEAGPSTGGLIISNVMRSALGGAFEPRFHYAPCITPALSTDEGGGLVLECRRRWAPGGGEAVGEVSLNPKP